MMLYWWLAVGLNYVVSVLLLLTAEQLAGETGHWKRILPAAVVEAAYYAWCLRSAVFGGFLIHLAVMLTVTGIAYGFPSKCPKSWLLYLLLEFGVNGMAQSLGKNDFGQLAIAALVLWIPICFLGASQKYVAVAIPCADSVLRLRALRDTGNTLTDPVSGEQVLIVGAEEAGILSGLSPNELQNPVQTVYQRKEPGLRLIPFHSVGNPNGMMLAKRIPNVRIGTKTASRLVAFAPQNLGGEDFQALAGGM